MDTQAILDQYRDFHGDPLYLLVGGKEVIGEYVSSTNELFFIIRQDGNLSLESAWNQEILRDLKHESMPKVILKKQ